MTARPTSTREGAGRGLARGGLARGGEFNYPYQKANFTLGATGYYFPNDLGFTKDFNTIELYGKVGLSVPLSPKFSAWYDVDKVKGLYVEGSISHTIQPKDQPFSVVLG